MLDPASPLVPAPGAPLGYPAERWIPANPVHSSRFLHLEMLVWLFKPDALVWGGQALGEATGCIEFDGDFSMQTPLFYRVSVKMEISVKYLPL